LPISRASIAAWPMSLSRVPERQLLDFGRRQALLPAEGDDQRRGGDGVLGVVVLALLQPGERRQRVRVALHRFDHPPDQRLEPGRIDMAAAAGGLHQVDDVVVRLA
jgi:hypothetical protein